MPLSMPLIFSFFYSAMRNYARKTNRKILTEAQRSEICIRVQNGESRRACSCKRLSSIWKTIRNYLMRVTSHAFSKVGLVFVGQHFLCYKPYWIKYLLFSACSAGVHWTISTYFQHWSGKTPCKILPTVGFSIPWNDAQKFATTGIWNGWNEWHRKWFS